MCVNNIAKTAIEIIVSNVSPEVKVQSVAGSTELSWNGAYWKHCMVLRAVNDTDLYVNMDGVKETVKIKTLGDLETAIKHLQVN